MGVQPEVPQLDLPSILQTRFRLEQFRKGQKEVIQSILKGKDTMAVMPTGGGKSLCYQLPAVCNDGIVVVICPLIALMEDQVHALKKLGIPAGYVNSSQTYESKQAVFSELKASKNYVLYLSPERVQKPGFAEWIKKQRISLFAIDESHCVSQWGPDFRKDYYRLNLLRELRPDVPILALTATATPIVLRDIVKQLGLREPERHIHGFYRPNLYCQVEPCDSENAKLEMVRSAILKHPHGRTLIYCGTRKQSEELTQFLSQSFTGTAFYHAGLSPEERASIQKDYATGASRILAATNAFGMGIDHPDVRLVIHFQMPANVESYYQEIGRAGRDGNPSLCLMLYSKRDKGLHSYFIQTSEADQATLKRRWDALDTMVHFSEGGECRHAGILTYFKDTQRIRACGHCDVCDPDSVLKVHPEKNFAASIAKKSRSKKQKAAFSETPFSKDEELRLDILRTWRKQYADENDIPAFIVFSNKTLEDLARKNPSTSEELEAVYGFGTHKVEHLGHHVLAQLAQCRPS